MAAMKFGFGQALTRKEDDPLLRGAGRWQRPEPGHVGGREQQAYARHGAHAIEIVNAETRMRVR